MEDMLPYYSTEGSIIYNIDHLLVSSNVSGEDSSNVPTNPSYNVSLEIDNTDVVSKGAKNENQHDLENIDVEHIEDPALEKDNEDDNSLNPSSNKMRHDSGFVDSPLNLPSENVENQFFASSPGVYVYVPSGNESIPCNEVFVVPPALRDPRCTCVSATQVFITGQDHSQPLQVIQHPPQSHVYSPSPFPGENLQHDQFFNSHFYNLNLIQASQHPPPMSCALDHNCHYSYTPGDPYHATRCYPYGCAPAFPIFGEAYYFGPQMEPVLPTMEDFPKYDEMLPMFEDGSTTSTPCHAFHEVPKQSIEGFRPGPKRSRKSFWTVPKQNREAFIAGPKQSRNPFWPDNKHGREPYWTDSKQRSKTFRTGPRYRREAVRDSPQHNRETFQDGHKHNNEAFRDGSKYSSEALQDGTKHTNEVFEDDTEQNSKAFQHSSKHSYKGSKHNSEALQDNPKYGSETFGDGRKHNRRAFWDDHRSGGEGFKHTSEKAFRYGGSNHSDKAFQAGHIQSKQVSLKKIIEPDHCFVAQKKVLCETGSKKVASHQATEIGAKVCRLKPEISKPQVDAFPLKSHIPGLPVELLIPKKTAKKKKKRKQKTEKEVKSFSSSDETGIGVGSAANQVMSHCDKEQTGRINIKSENLEPLEANSEEQLQELETTDALAHRPVGHPIVAGLENSERKSTQETKVDSLIDVMDENNSHEGSIGIKQNISSDKTDCLPLPSSKDSPLLLMESSMAKGDLDNQEEAIPLVKWMESKVPFEEVSNEDLMRSTSDAANEIIQIIDEIINDVLEPVELTENNQYADNKECQVDQICIKDQNESVECTESKPNLSKASDFEELNNIEGDVRIELHSSVKVENSEQNKSINSFPKRKVKKAKTDKLVLQEEEKINHEHIELEKEEPLMECLEEIKLDGKGQKSNKKLRKKDKPKLEPISIPLHRVMINDSNWQFVCSNKILHATETLSPSQIESVETTNSESSILVHNLGEGMHRGCMAQRIYLFPQILLLKNPDSGDVLDKNEDVAKELQDREHLNIGLD